MEIKINLVPEYRKMEIAKSNRVKMILRWELEITLILAIFFILILSLNYILKFNLDASIIEMESKRGGGNYEKISKFDNDFKIINSRTSINDAIQGDQLYWSIVFKKMSEMMPDGIIISKAANKNYKVFLAGVADTRDNLIRMKDELAKNDCFSGINLPLSNLTSRDNVDFQMEFDIKEDCLKNK